MECKLECKFACKQNMANTRFFLDWKIQSGLTPCASLD